MKRFFTLLYAVVMVSAVALSQNKPLPKSQDWAQFSHYQEKNAEIVDRVGKIDAVFLGNSITYGWARKCADFFEKNNFVGRGISGQTTAEMLVRFRRDVLDLKPRCVVIMAGINDIAGNNGIISLENVMGGIESMCELAKIHKIKVVLCSVTPSARKTRYDASILMSDEIIKLNEMIRSYARKNKICYVDYHSALADEKGGMPTKWTRDALHPNTACMVSVLQPLVLEAVNKTLKTKKNYISPMPEKK
jgi:lysophospholipase L1-like esterase